jgi:CRP-like cAMP-binding protein
MQTSKAKALCTDAVWVGRADCRHCKIRDQVLFANVPDDVLDNILTPIDNYTYPNKAVLYEVGYEDRGIFTIRSGMVKLIKLLPNGTERVVRLLRAGDVAGLEVLLGNSYSHKAVVTHTANVCNIPVKVIHDIERQDPDLHDELIARWQRTVDDADHFIACFSTGSAQARIARLLLKLCADSRDNFCVSLSREDMGAILGITSETTARVVANLKREGVLDERNGYFRCNSKETLKNFSDDTN